MTIPAPLMCDCRIGHGECGTDGPCAAPAVYVWPDERATCHYCFGGGLRGTDVGPWQWRDDRARYARRIDGQPLRPCPTGEHQSELDCPCIEPHHDPDANATRCGVCNWCLA